MEADRTAASPAVAHPLATATFGPPASPRAARSLITGPSTGERETTPTRNRLHKTVRATSVNLLQSALTSALDLALQTKQSHWNVKGPGFIAIHKMLDDINDDLHEAADTIAERLVALGGFAEGRAAHIQSTTPLSHYLGGGTDSSEILGALANGYSEFGDLLVAQIDETDKIGDPTTADVLTEASRMIDKSLWLIEAHLPSETE